ncbi:acyltransferase [Mesorhizobium sp. B2-5-7]|uniref:acyltransferase family protein n=1 Tax=Mesorhizobium sp. B2-5-7 TaxID=2589923 RepID=UPI00112C9FF8|nr:acyltransferase [Mesorhizobium sp. B2-5-7]TPK18050.1 acyltransferase [Mesorhizobium sp. B2-5-7]
MTIKKTFAGLQGLRAIAATLVVAQHAGYFAYLSTGTDSKSFLRLQLGVTGVFIFFVISGAVMALATTREGPRAFAMSRLTRIYPAFFLALVFAFVVLWIAGIPPQITPDPSLLLMPTGTLNSTFNVPYWTLIYEMQFYFLLWLAMLCRTSHQIRMWLAVGWGAVILAAGAAGISVPAASPTAAQIPFASVNLFFVIGYVMASGIMTKDWGPFFALLVLTSVMTVYANAWSGSYLGLAVLCASAVFVAMKADAVLVPAWLAKAGDYSYGLYLAHMSIIAAIYSWAPGWPFWAMISVMLCTGLVGGLAFGRLEQWLYVRYWRPLAKTAKLDQAYWPPVAVEPAALPGR